VTAGRAAAPALLCAIAIAGCGGASRHRDARPSALARAQAAHEYPSPPPPPQTAADPAPTATQAIRAFATAYINWNAQTVSADMRELASRSVGQARAAMRLAAAQTAGDYELREGGIANSGAVEALAPLSGHAGEYVVVTQESTSASNTTAYQGLGPAWHLALATVEQLPGGRWALSGWQPEN
jgi:hypothetical protein